MYVLCDENHFSVGITAGEYLICTVLNYLLTADKRVLFGISTGVTYLLAAVLSTQ